MIVRLVKANKTWITILILPVIATLTLYQNCYTAKMLDIYKETLTVFVKLWVKYSEVN